MLENKEIIKVNDEQIPTIVAYDFDKQQIIIGKDAREQSLIGNSNIYNFKLDLGEVDSLFREKKKYWYAIPFTDGKRGAEKTETFTPKEIISKFISNLIKDVPLPEELMVGVPAITDKKWSERFRRHMREVFEDINQDLGISLKPQFFPEPFAIFQYYKHIEKAFDTKGIQETILVIDIGAGTFNSCIIQTTADGYLSRGGVNQHPIGLFAEAKGGFFLDKEIVKHLVEKARKKGVEWKEDPLNRIGSSKVPILLLVEDAKINLSEQFHKNASIKTSHKKYTATVTFPAGSLHQELVISEEINGDDLKNIIDNIWRNHWAKIIYETIKKSEEKIKKEIKKIDRVIVAGGPSKLPFMKTEIETALRQYGVDRKDIYIGEDPGNAVAFGIAAECRERANRNPKLGSGKIAPSLITDIFFAFKKDRNRQSKFYVPSRLKINGELITNGQLISSPFELPDSTLTFEMEFPFSVGDNLYYYFSNTPFDNSQKEDLLNLNDYSVSMSHLNKVIKKFRLELIVKGDSIKPIFQVKEKRSARKNGFTKVEGCEFFHDEADIKEGESFLGIDFGTSNSYLARFINQKHQITTSEYPIFEVSSQVARKLLSIEKEYKESVKEDLFSLENIRLYLLEKKCLHIYQSNKIEGNPLSKGETEELILRKSSAESSLPKLEAINLSNAFDWVCENLQFCLEQPGPFIRQLHNLVLNKIEPGAGEYRKRPVKLSCMDFEPPPSGSVPAFMDQLHKEIQEGCNGRSIIEFACTIHTKFVYIHPFVDGNGRTARLLMNAILWVHNSPGIIVNAIDKPRYLDALAKSNSGDLSPLLSFFIDGYNKEYAEFLNFVQPSENLAQSKYAEPPVISKNISINHIDDENIDAVDPIAEVLKKKSESIKDSYKDSLNEVQQSFTKILEEFEGISSPTSEYIELKKMGYKISITRFSTLDLDSFYELVINDQSLPVWFFKIEISRNGDHVCLLFSHNRASSHVERIKGSNEVSLTISREKQGEFFDLNNEAIYIREIGVCDNTTFIINNEQAPKKMNQSTISRKIIANLLEQYI